MTQKETYGTMREYVTGFILSIVLTVIPLVLVLNHLLGTSALIIVIVAMAVLQFLVQLFFFMHIRETEKPRYNVMALVFGLVFIVAIVGGSVWIMTFNAQVH
ncbi:cytochrome o ubiquinol oxidase subunit IV [Ferviditalea candida]|uniref:Cytochrome o ubiquinol oxidase subunit IV n=1 Tax=Ferviditalea candida TaxID=3108399 RepID=A0ABU5ZHD6_9BACL|nr:cytochrome o ubiquinol oxidase subunit IV [Paenibacillaceae bacterium T2]